MVATPTPIEKATAPAPAQPGDEDSDVFEVNVANNRPADVAPPVLGASPADSAAAPSGAAPSAEPDDELSAALAGILDPERVQEGVEWLFEMAAHRRGEHWSVKPYEAREIAEPLAIELQDLAEHAPFLGGAADAVGGNRLRLLIALGVTVGPRLALDSRLAKERRAAALASRPQASRTAARDTSPLEESLESAATAPAPDNSNRPPVDFMEAMARTRNQERA